MTCNSPVSCSCQSKYLVCRMGAIQRWLSSSQMVMSASPQSRRSPQVSRERCWQLKRLSSAAAGPPVWLWSMGVYAAHMLTRYVVCCCTCTSTPGRAGHASSSLPGVIPDASHLYAGNGPAALAIAQTDGPADEPGDEAQPSTDPVPGGPHPPPLLCASPVQLQHPKFCSGLRGST